MSTFLCWLCWRFAFIEGDIDYLLCRATGRLARFDPRNHFWAFAVLLDLKGYAPTGCDDKPLWRVW